MTNVKGAHVNFVIYHWRLKMLKFLLNLLYVTMFQSICDASRNARELPAFNTFHLCSLIQNESYISDLSW